MKNFLKNKWVIGGIIITVALIAWYLWDKRKYNFLDFGEAKYLPKGRPTRPATDALFKATGFSVEKEPHFKKDDVVTIETNFGSPHFSTGNVKVLDIFKDGNVWWVITDATSWAGSSGMEPGTIKKA